MPCETVPASVSRSGGQPTGTMAFATSSRITLTASPSRKIWTSWPRSVNALACRNAKLAFLGSSEPQALFSRMRAIAYRIYNDSLGPAREILEEGCREGLQHFQ